MPSTPTRNAGSHPGAHVSRRYDNEEERRSVLGEHAAVAMFEAARCRPGLALRRPPPMVAPIWHLLGCDEVVPPASSTPQGGP